MVKDDYKKNLGQNNSQCSALNVISIKIYLFNQQGDYFVFKREV